MQWPQSLSKLTALDVSPLSDLVNGTLSVNMALADYSPDPWAMLS